MSRKRIIENSISLGVVQIVNLGLPLLWLPYLARVLGAEQLGRVAFALSIAQMMVVLTDYGFNLSASKAVAVHRSDKKRVAEIWCSVSASRAILAFFGLIALPVTARACAIQSGPINATNASRRDGVCGSISFSACCSRLIQQKGNMMSMFPFAVFIATSLS